MKPKDHSYTMGCQKAIGKAMTVVFSSHLPNPARAKKICLLVKKI
jgi:hypothetical protein